MTCEYKERVIAYLNEEDDGREDAEIENHIADCPQCAALVEGYLLKSQEIGVTIPEVKYQGDADGLLERVKKRDSGRRRIVFFTIVGFLLGLLSYYYTADHFIVTKILMAIPYKLSEEIYSSLYPVMHLYEIYYVPNMGVFPQNYVVSLLAERITPAVFAACALGSLGYFTGDKRVFTLKRFGRFLCGWMIVLTVFVASMFAVNGYCLAKSAQLTGIEGITIYSENRENEDGHGSERFYWSDNGSGEDRDAFDAMVRALDGAEKLSGKREFYQGTSQTNLLFYMGFDGNRRIFGTIDREKQLLILESGDQYRVSEEFLSLVEGYAREEEAR